MKPTAAQVAKAAQCWCHETTNMIEMDTRLAERFAQALADERKKNIEVAKLAWPRAHTYASENADLYIAQDHVRDTIIEAIKDQP